MQPSKPGRPQEYRAAADHQAVPSEVEAMTDLILLARLERYGDQGLFLLRLLVGAFLVWGVWDNIGSAERMQEFVEFLRKFHFPVAEFMARLSVWAQFAIGLAFAAGL